MSSVVGFSLYSEFAPGKSYGILIMIEWGFRDHESGDSKDTHLQEDTPGRI